MRPPISRWRGGQGAICAPGCLAAVLAVALSAQPPPTSFHVLDEEPGAWPEIFGAVGFQPLGPAGGGGAKILVVRAGGSGSGIDWAARLADGAFLVLEGESPAAEQFGFRAGKKRIVVRSLQDVHRPALPIVWEHALELPVFETPAEARVFAWERWERAPLVAGFRRGPGAVLWVAAPPGRLGYERFPYILHALADLGLDAPFRSRRLWAFFDSSYRSRVDLDYFAKRWRSAGVAALHVAAWHYYEPDPQRDERLRNLIRSCHRQGVLVYAWLELPHVGEKFWNDHPEWREKTALGQDAHLDWRKLMNLTSRECFQAAAQGVRRLIERFDWDGVNLAELYFESLEGAANPARFTPMNDNVRREFRQARGFDPLELFQPASANHHARNAAGLRAFLDYRAGLARRIQAEWIAEIEAVRRGRPDLDLVLTHVDDRFDTGMRDAIGADAAALLPLLDRHNFTFLIEDPATVWHLGPQRYPEIAKRYQPITRHAKKLAIDINVVERYQNVYPTKQQTGTELFQLVRLASGAFPRVALYFENSILPPDWPLVPAAAAVVSRVERIGPKLAVESARGVGLRWQGPALVNGRPWPVRDAAHLWLPAGLQVVEQAGAGTYARLLDFNGELKTALSLPRGIEFSYESSSRALAVLDRKPARLQIDGVPAPPSLVHAGETFTLALPRGQHLVVIEVE